MNGGRAPRLGGIRAVEAGTRVGRLEVFFDLVFVYAFYNVARFVTKELTVLDLVQGILVLAMLWLCWVSHLLVAQRVRLAEGYAPLVTFAAMAAITAIAGTIPWAFGGQVGGAPGPVLFPACYLVIRGLHHWLHWQAAATLPGERRQLARLGVAALVATTVLFLAGILPWFVDAFDSSAARIGLWSLAVLIEYGTGLAVGFSGWRLAAPGHFVERFELMIIVALGETIISIGIGSGVIGRPITWPAFFSSIIGVVVLATLWWAYFDLVAPAAELAMHNSEGHARIALARDAYIYLHLPIVAGLMLLALGGEDVLRFLGSAHVDLGKPVAGLGTPLLFVALALYLLGLVLFQLRALGHHDLDPGGGGRSVCRPRPGCRSARRRGDSGPAHRDLRRPGRCRDPRARRLAARSAPDDPPGTRRARGAGVGVATSPPLMAAPPAQGVGRRPGRPGGRR